MLNPSYCDPRSRKLFKLKPHSFAQLLKYMDAEFLAEPERFPETISSVHAGHEGHDDIQGQGDFDPAVVLQLILVGYLVMVVIFIISAYLRSLF